MFDLNINNRIRLFLLALFFLGFLAVSLGAFTSELKLLALFLGVVLFLTAFVNTDLALVFLIFSMLLSPELALGGVGRRAIVIRADDIFIIVVFLGWLAKMAVNKNLGLLRATPLNAAIIGYIAVCIFTTAFGVFRGTTKLLSSFFYILKYTEYFLLYFLITNNIGQKRQVKILVAALLLTCFLVCIYALMQSGAALHRASAPFEGAEGEPNTFGGYLILIFALCAGLFLYSPTLRWRVASGSLACLILPTFLLTYSRSSYFASIPMFLGLLFFSQRKKFLLIVILILLIVVTPLVLPRITQSAVTRVESTFIPGRYYRPLGKPIPLEESAAARVDNWKSVIKQWKKYPIFGYGVAGVGLVDSQYPLVLGETGIIGLLFFLWLIIVIFRNGLHIFNNLKDDWPKGLALGFIAGFIGLLTHSFGVNTFIIVRIMEPFWFLTAIVMVLPEIDFSSPKEDVSSQGR
jgi:O-antigen ligase